MFVRYLKPSTSRPTFMLHFLYVRRCTIHLLLLLISKFVFIHVLDSQSVHDSYQASIQINKNPIGFLCSKINALKNWTWKYVACTRFYRVPYLNGALLRFSAWRDLSKNQKIKRTHFEFHAQVGVYLQCPFSNCCRLIPDRPIVTRTMCLRTRMRYVTICTLSYTRYDCDWCTICNDVFGIVAYTGRAAAFAGKWQRCDQNGKARRRRASEDDVGQSKELPRRRPTTQVSVPRARQIYGGQRHKIQISVKGPKGVQNGIR